MSTCLDKAADIVSSDRMKIYGHPKDNLGKIAELWSSYLGTQVSPADVANLMILLKIGRIRTGGYHKDGATDIAGYARVLEILHEEK